MDLGQRDRLVNGGVIGDPVRVKKLKDRKLMLLLRKLHRSHLQELRDHLVAEVHTQSVAAALVILRSDTDITGGKPIL